MQEDDRAVSDRLWAEEAEKRIREIEDGEVTLLDGHQVVQEIRDRLREAQNVCRGGVVRFPALDHVQEDVEVD